MIRENENNVQTSFFWLSLYNYPYYNYYNKYMNNKFPIHRSKETKKKIVRTNSKKNQ